MIFLADYFGPWMEHKDATEDRKANAEELLVRVADLLDEAFLYEITLEDNPATGNLIAGKTYGGFRPQDCPQGASTSSHKEGKGVDIYDPQNALDNWLTDEILERHGLYREAPLATKSWCHLTYRAPKSGKRTFQP